MNKSLKFLVISIAISGISSMAAAAPLDDELLVDPGFDNASGAWTETNAYIACSGPVKSDDCAAVMHPLDADGTGSVNQEVDVTGCSYYGLAEYQVGGYARTNDLDDAGVLKVYFDTYVEATSATIPGSTGSQYIQGTWIGNIPHGAMTANVEASGTSTDNRANVRWDDMHFGVDCVTDFAKVSGKFRLPAGSCGDNCGGYKRGLVSLGGAWGYLESGELVGSIGINYKFANTTCTYTPIFGSEVYLDDLSPGQDGAGYASTYTCEGDVATAGDAVWALFEGAGGSNKGGSAKDRGCVQVIHLTGAPPMPVFDQCLLGPLSGGNVDVDSDTSN